MSKNNEASTLKNSYLLMDFFEDLKKMLIYLPADEVRFVVDENRTAKFLKYQIVYKDNDDNSISELLTHALRFSDGKGSKNFYDNFDEVMTVIEKENVALRPFTSKTTLQEFMGQFSKMHQIALIKHELTETLPVNEINADTKKLKL